VRDRESLKVLSRVFLAVMENDNNVNNVKSDVVVNE